ncbi:MAG: hypothetical protein ACFE96_01475 [Candidatus Hermodarchaeota archaeon]
MVRELTPNRWNWSQKDNMWVFIESRDGELNYYYQKNPPEEFYELTAKIKVLNDKLIACKDPNENAKIYSQMMRISKRMQSMDRIC